MSNGGIAAVVLRARKRVEEDFESLSATGPDRAAPYAPRHRAIHRRVFRSLIGFGAIVETTPGRFYLDRDRMQAYRLSRRKRVAAILGLAAAGIGAAIALGA